MFTISKRCTFEAAHQLRRLPAGHPCSRLHGHSYTVEIVLQSETLDDAGFVLDYGQLAPFKQYLDSAFDHRYLNDVLPENPTVENLAHHFYEWAHARWAQVSAVRVSETAKTYGEYRP